MKRLTLILAVAFAVTAANATLLWKIVPPGSDKASYLLGTHHLADASALAPYPSIDSLVAATDVMLCELSAEEMNDPMISATLQNYMLAPADSTLSKVLSPASLATLDSLLQSYGIGTVALFEPLNPMAASTTLQMMVLLKEMPQLAASGGIDKIMMARALAANKEVLGLETMQQQAQLLFGMPIAEQAAALEKMLSDHSDIASESRRLIELYVAGDIDGLYDMASASISTQEERLITERNAAWVNFLLAMLPSSAVMIVVGAGHLGGPQGLIQLLRNHNYEVTPIQPLSI